MCSIILSIKPEFVNKIISKEKKYEYRRVVAKKRIDSILIYSTYPEMCIVAEAKVHGILSGEPKEIWEATKHNSGIDYDRYINYFRDSNKAFAYILDDVKEFPSPKTLDEYGISYPPQSFCYVSE